MVKQEHVDRWLKLSHLMEKILSDSDRKRYNQHTMKMLKDQKQSISDEEADEEAYDILKDYLQMTKEEWIGVLSLLRSVKEDFNRERHMTKLEDSKGLFESEIYDLGKKGLLNDKEAVSEIKRNRGFVNTLDDVALAKETLLGLFKSNNFQYHLISEGMNAERNAHTIRLMCKEEDIELERIMEKIPSMINNVEIVLELWCASKFSVETGRFIHHNFRIIELSGDEK